MLNRLRRLIKVAYGDIKKPLDPFSNPWATAATPDDIIEASIIQSIAKDFDDWKMMSRPSGLPVNKSDRHQEWYNRWHKYHSNANMFTCNAVLQNEKKNLLIAFRENYYDEIHDTFYVNDVSLPTDKGRKIVEAYNKIKSARARVKREADARLAEMKRLEQAWNLAESLLGMKRNEFGALVPVEKEM